MIRGARVHGCRSTTDRPLVVVGQGRYRRRLTAAGAESITISEGLVIAVIVALLVVVLSARQSRIAGEAEPRTANPVPSHRDSEPPPHPGPGAADGDRAGVFWGPGVWMFNRVLRPGGRERCDPLPPRRSLAVRRNMAEPRCTSGSGAWGFYHTGARR
jgi:hypothetical protein